LPLAELIGTVERQLRSESLEADSVSENNISYVGGV
jgi:hypothetical protein